MPKPFYHEQAVVIDGEALRLVINFRALDAIETLTGQDFDTSLVELQSGKARTGLICKVVWGLLREHHPEMTIDQATSLVFGEIGVTVGVALQSLLEAAFPVAEEAKGENPPKRRGASSAS